MRGGGTGLDEVKKDVKAITDGTKEFTKIGVGELCDFEKTKRLVKVNGPVDFGITGGGGSTTDRVKSILRGIYQMCDLYGASGPEVVANTLLEVYGKSQFKGDIDASGVKLIVKSIECDDVVTLDKFASGVIKHIGIGCHATMHLLWRQREQSRLVSMKTKKRVSTLSPNF